MWPEGYVDVYADGEIRRGWARRDVINGPGVCITSGGEEGEKIVHWGEWTDGVPNGIGETINTSTGEIIRGQFTPSLSSPIFSDDRMEEIKYYINKSRLAQDTMHSVHVMNMEGVYSRGKEAKEIVRKVLASKSICKQLSKEIIEGLRNMPEIPEPIIIPTEEEILNPKKNSTSSKPKQTKTTKEISTKPSKNSSKISKQTISSPKKPKISMKIKIDPPFQKEPLMLLGNFLGYIENNFPDGRKEEEKAEDFQRVEPLKLISEERPMEICKKGSKRPSAFEAANTVQAPTNKKEDNYTSEEEESVEVPQIKLDFSSHKNLNSSNKIDSQPHSPALLIQFKRLETVADKAPATPTHQNLSSSSSAHETSYFTQPPPAIQLPQSQAEQTPDQQPQMSKDNSNEPLKRQNSFNSRAKSAIGELEVALSFQAEAVHRKLSRRNSGHSRSGASGTVDLKMPGEELAESTAFLLPTVHKGSFVIPNKSTPSPEVQASNPGSLQDPTPQRAYSNRPSQTSHNGLPVLNLAKERTDRARSSLTTDAMSSPLAEFQQHLFNYSLNPCNVIIS